MPEETTIVGDKICEFLHKRANESVNVQLHEGNNRVLAGFIFARDRHRPIRKCQILILHQETLYLNFAWLYISTIFLS